MDLRQYLEVLDREGLLLQIDREVDWNLEAAAIISLMQRCGEGRYALLFNRVKDYYPDKGRLAGCLISGPYKRNWERLALALGFPRDIDYDVFVKELYRRSNNPIKPIEVSRAEAPCKEIVKIGKEANLLDLPIPMVHATDGGRYLTLSWTINKDPDTGWTNVAIYRFMVKSPRRWAQLFTPGQQGPTIYFMKWEARGKTMPICVAVGSDPLLLTACASQAPAGMCEYDLVGALRQEPFPVVRAETNDLLVPADAEIIIEGEVRPYERTDEGPFGEMVGFTHGRNISPVFRVTAITHRKNPVIPITVEGVTMQDDGGMGCWGMEWSAIAYLQSRGHRVPYVRMYPLNPPPWTISCDPETPLESIQMIHDFFGFKSMIWVPWLTVIDTGIDMVDWSNVIEEIGLNCNPAEFGKNQTDLDAMNHPLNFYSDAEERFRMSGGGKYAYDCTTKFREPRFKPIRDTLERAYPDEVKERAKELWAKFGFDKPFELRLAP